MRGLSRDLVDRVVDLPGTQDMSDIMTRTNALIQWQNSLKKGYVLHYPKFTFSAASGLCLPGS